MAQFFRATKPRVLVASFAAAGLLALSGVGIGAYAAASGPAKIESISAFQEAQSAHDRTPASIDLAALGHSGVVAGTTRYLGADEDAVYYAALDKVGFVCAIVALKDSSLFVSSCATDSDIKSGGLGIGAYDGITGTEVTFYVVPDGAASSGTGGTLVGQNILRTVPGVAAQERLGKSTVTLDGVPPAARQID